jgi:hypothetical protein
MRQTIVPFRLQPHPFQGHCPTNSIYPPVFRSPESKAAQSSCVGWAVGYALKTYQEHSERGWDLREDDHVFSPSYIYNQINPSGNCDTGTYITDALELMVTNGAAPLSVFPYGRDCTRLPDQFVHQEASQYRSASWRRVNVQSISDVQSHLVAGFPVIIGLMLHSNFWSYTGGVYSSTSGPPTGGHAMVVVGYDNARSAFRVINSWGTEWGEQGYAWISYGIFRALVREGYAVQDIIVRPAPAPEVVVRPTPPPAPEPAPVVVNPSPPPEPDRDITWRGDVDLSAFGLPRLRFGMDWGTVSDALFQADVRDRYNGVGGPGTFSLPDGDVYGGWIQAFIEPKNLSYSRIYFIFNNDNNLYALYVDAYNSPMDVNNCEKWVSGNIYQWLQRNFGFSGEASRVKTAVDEGVYWYDYQKLGSLRVEFSSSFTKSEAWCQITATVVP